MLMLTYLLYYTYLPYIPTLHDQCPKHCTKQVPLREEKPSSVTQLLESRYAYACLLTYYTIHTYLNYLPYLPYTTNFQNTVPSRFP